MSDHLPTLLFLDQYGAIGGGQRILLDLVAAARSRGSKVHLLCPSGPLADLARQRGAEVHAIDLPSMRSGPKSLLTMVRAWFSSHRIALEHRTLAGECDLLVVNGPRTIGIAREWVRGLHKPAVLYLHGVYGALENLLIRSFLRLPRTAAIAPSPIIAAPFAGLKNLHTISNWVSQEFLTSPRSPDRLRQVLGITDLNPIVLVPGRFSPNKGQLLVLEAQRQLLDLPCHFVFSGAPLFEERGRAVEQALTAAAKAEPQRVHVMHWEGALPALFDGADIVVVPSVWQEPFGLTAVEAMARGCPLIVTDRGMLPQIAQGGRMARVVPAQADAIASALRDFFSHRPEWEVKAREARRYVEEEFSPSHRQRQVLHVFESLLPS